MKRTKTDKKLKTEQKCFYCYAYDAFAKMLKLQWDMPTYTQEDHDPFVPDETELDALINAATQSKRVSYFSSMPKRNVWRSWRSA